MQSDPKYREATLSVLLPLTDDDSRERYLREHAGIPIDGRIEIQYPDELSKSGHFTHEFPFRDDRKDSEPWSANPDAKWGSRRPIWKWTNPEQDPHENITLNPSIGMQPDGEWKLHCWVRNGEIDLL